MKQKEVIEKLIRETKSGEMVWDERIERFSDSERYRARFNGSNYQFIEYFLNQELVYNGKSIIKGVRILRPLYWAILEQLKHHEDDNLAGIYNDILTG